MCSSFSHAFGQRHPPTAVLPLLHPVVEKGFFLPGFNVSYFDPAGRSEWSERFVPCDFAGWCNSTNGFDCSQVRTHSMPAANGLLVAVRLSCLS